MTPLERMNQSKLCRLVNTLFSIIKGIKEWVMKAVQGSCSVLTLEGVDGVDAVHARLEDDVEALLLVPAAQVLQRTEENGVRKLGEQTLSFVFSVDFFAT